MGQNFFLGLVRQSDNFDMPDKSLHNPGTLNRKFCHTNSEPGWMKPHFKNKKTILFFNLG